MVGTVGGMAGGVCGVEGIAEVTVVRSMCSLEALFPHGKKRGAVFSIVPGTGVRGYRLHYRMHTGRAVAPCPLPNPCLRLSFITGSRCTHMQLLYCSSDGLLGLASWCQFCSA